MRRSSVVRLLIPLPRIPRFHTAPSRAVHTNGSAIVRVPVRIRSSHQVLLTMVVGGVVPMLARVSIAMYVLAVMTRQCRHAASCEGAYAIGWFGLAGEMFGTLVVSVAATHHMLDTRKTRVAQETAVLEAADNKMRAKGVAELKQSLRKSFKAWGSELELIFKDFDEDGNGMMDREELCKGLKTLGADFSDEQAGWLFDKSAPPLLRLTQREREGERERERRRSRSKPLTILELCLRGVQLTWTTKARSITARLPRGLAQLNKLSARNSRS